MNTLPKLIRETAIPLAGSPRDFDPLLDRARDAKFVLLGEATHGTHEFYRVRAQITRRLIEELGFSALAVEADWPDAYRVNRFVRGASGDLDSVDALAGFKRFPQWMWRNADVLDFVGWLRSHNDQQSGPERKVGFYGLDLYSLHASMDAVLAYLGKVDPQSLPRARQRYACFHQFGNDTQTYGLAAGLGISRDCQDAVVTELTELRLREAHYLECDGRLAADEFFCAEQNALVVKNAEQYYRTMYRGEVSSWNLRDRHMMETLAALAAHLEDTSRPARIVVWAHNSHIGNASATQMRERAEISLGQLVREHFGPAALLVGFTTALGTVTAASDWDAPAERKFIQSPLRESYEALLHDSGIPRFWLDLQENQELAFNLNAPRLERAIGVIYRPETELASHYFTAHLPDQFDALFHFDETRAVEPLERTTEWVAGEVEETFPTGI